MVFLLVVFAVATDWVADSYTAGAARSAVDEAARAGALYGAPGGPVTACQTKASQVLDGILDGVYGHDITITCTIDGNQVVAVADGTLPAIVNLAGRIHIHATGTAILQTAGGTA